MCAVDPEDNRQKFSYLLRRVKAFNYSVTENQIGIADGIREYTVHAEDEKKAFKKLKRFLENLYEDAIEVELTSEGRKGSLYRNGGHLIINLGEE